MPSLLEIGLFITNNVVFKLFMVYFPNYLTLWQFINNPNFYTVTFEVLKWFFNVHTNIFNCAGRDLFQNKTLNNLIYYIYFKTKAIITLNNITTKASWKIKLNPNRKKYSTLKYNNKYIEGITRLKQKISTVF